MIHQSIINKLEVLTKYVELEKLVDVNKENYNHVLYEYKLNKGSVECQCSEDRSNVCSTKHGHGFVVVLSDGSKSIIGNSCIKKFDSESDIRRHINVLRNTQRRIDKLESIEKYYSNYNGLLVQVQDMFMEVKEISSLKMEFNKYLGNERTNFAKSPKLIRVVGGKVRQYIDENGDNKEERNKATYDIESILGKHIIDSEKIFDMFYEAQGRFLKGMNNVKVLLEKIENSDPSESQINAYRYQLEEIKEVRRTHKEIVEGWTLFKSNDPRNLVFAYSKPYKLVKYFLESSSLDVKDFCYSIRNDFKENKNLDFLILQK